MGWQWQQMTNIDVSTVFCFGVTYISTFCGLFYLFLVFQTPTDTYTDIETILTNLHFVDDDNINFYDFTLENFRQLARFVATKPASERTTDTEERIKQAPEFLKRKLIFVQWLKLVGLYHKYWFK